MKITTDVEWKTGGEIAGNVTATACPSVSCTWVKFKAPSTNTGTVAVGTNSDVELPDGSDGTKTGWPLGAGEETDWLPVPEGELSNVYNIAENAGDDLVYKYMV